MSKFTLMINRTIIAEQIASLLNTYNRLRTTHTSSSILASNTNYIIEQAVVNNTLMVVGCVGICPTCENTTLIKHLSVEENTRKTGVATKLLHTALHTINTDFAHMDIRSDNYPSLKLAEKLGFLIVAQKQKLGYNIVTVGRNINDYRRINRLC